MVTIALAGAAVVGTAASAGAQGDTVDRGYDPVRSMYFHFQPLSIDEAKEVQRALRREGVHPGPVDGVIGPATQAALAEYQRRHALAPTGEPDGATLARLRVGPAHARESTEPAKHVN
jgi:peptidoglycan hydrolase-like protein with peptidoglycan-binding domain